MEHLQLDVNKLSDINYVNSLKREAQLCYSIEQSAKLSLNSIYGALANDYFYWNLTAMAEAITLQGQDVIKLSEVLVNDFFKFHVHTDRELLTKLGVPEDKVLQPFDKEVVVYIDTDSAVFSTLLNIKETFIEIELEDNSILSFHEDDLIKVIRNNKEIDIFAKDLLNTDNIIL